MPNNFVCTIGQTYGYFKKDKLNAEYILDHEINY